MKIICNKNHGILDYVTVIAFAVIPTVFGLAGVPMILSYVLAVVHLLMTILTRFPLGLVKVIPIEIHQWVERIVGPVLVISPWLLGFQADMTARAVFIGAGVVIIAVGLFSRYDRPQTT